MSTLGRRQHQAQTKRQHHLPLVVRLALEHLRSLPRPCSQHVVLLHHQTPSFLTTIADVELLSRAGKHLSLCAADLDPRLCFVGSVRRICPHLQLHYATQSIWGVMRRRTSQQLLFSFIFRIFFASDTQPKICYSGIVLGSNQHIRSLEICAKTSQKNGRNQKTYQRLHLCG